MLRFYFFLCAIAITFKVNAVDENNKTVLLAILARNKEHVLHKYLNSISKLDYDKKLITLYINTNNNEDKTKDILISWMKEHKKEYRDIIFDNIDVKFSEVTKPHEWTTERFKILGAIRNKSLRKAKELGTDYYFVVDCDNFIAPFTLKELISKDKPIIAPMLKAIPEPDDHYSNFFCAVDKWGYWEFDPQYPKILHHEIVGTFKVPVVHCTYLVKTQYINRLNYIDDTDDYEFVIFSRLARKHGIDQFICNERDFGVLLHFNDDLTLEQERRRIEGLLSL